MPEPVTMLKKRSDGLIAASRERCTAAFASIAQTTELIAITRNTIAHSRAMLVRYTPEEATDLTRRPSTR